MGLHEQFRDLTAAHYERVWAYVSFLTGRSSDTEDLVHQAFLLAFERLANGAEFAGDPGAWLCGAARNLVFEWWRKKRKLPEALAEQLEAVAERCEDAFAQAADAEVADALRQCLGKLTPSERELIRRRYEDGQRIARLAEWLQVKEVTVRTRLHRLRQALKRCLETQLGRGTPYEA